MLNDRIHVVTSLEIQSQATQVFIECVKDTIAKLGTARTRFSERSVEIEATLEE
ncbi:MAG: hypothetical protein Q9181_007663, partial [Wetmoreana brouardii]